MRIGESRRAGKVPSQKMPRIPAPINGSLT